jgi:hypothetical protein
MINLGKEMVASLKAASEKLKGEIGSDRVSQIYAGVLPPCVVDLPQGPEERAKITAEAARRARLHIAPGYKDQTKEDGGIGDLMIWLTALQEADKRKKHCIFVTNEQKSDWWVKSRGTFQPRPELLEEYRRHSEGKSVHFLPLSGLLASFEATAHTVEEVQKLEDTRREMTISGFPARWPGHSRTPLDEELKELFGDRRRAEQTFLSISSKIENLEREIASKDAQKISPSVWKILEKLKRERSVIQAIISVSDSVPRSPELDSLFREVALNGLKMTPMFDEYYKSYSEME